jgi:hypothetical protein
LARYQAKGYAPKGESNVDLELAFDWQMDIRAFDYRRFNPLGQSRGMVGIQG